MNLTLIQIFALSMFIGGLVFFQMMINWIYIRIINEMKKEITELKKELHKR
jgi:hypothetical protein